MKIRKNGTVINLTEGDIEKIAKKVLNEQLDSHWSEEDNFDWEEHARNLENERNSVKQSWETLSKIASGGGECAELAKALEFIVKDIKSTSDSAMSNTWKG